MVIDSKKEKVQINCTNIDQLNEDQNSGNLKLVYFMPVQEESFMHIQKKGELQRIKTEFECCENALLLKTYQGIRAKTIQAEAEAETDFKDLDLGEQQTRAASMFEKPVIKEDHM